MVKRDKNKLNRWSLISALLFLFLTSLTISLLPLKPQTESKQIAVTRADFAASYLRFEQTLLAANLSPGEAARVNREFDSLTLQFFSRNYQQALKKLHLLTASLHPQGKEEDPAVFSLAVRINPTVYVKGSGHPAISVESLYPPEKSYGKIFVYAALRLRLPGNRTGRVIQIPVSVDFRQGEPIRIELKPNFNPARLDTGAYELGIVHNKSFIQTGSWYVVRENFDSLREQNEKILTKLEIDPERPYLQDAVKTVRARNRLLSQSPSPENTAQTVLDLYKLAESIKSEIKELQRGRNPFKGKNGDFWRIIPDSSGEVPFRLYVPERVISGSNRPLVVAFHGAGGDENMFMEGYGAGLLKKLAEKMGFILVTPFSNKFVGDRAGLLFDRLLELLEADYGFNPKRIYVLGHSMGAMVANRLCLERSDRIAAAVLLCGLQGFPGNNPKIPPVLVVAGELDPLASPARIEPIVNQARELALPVFLRVIPDYGHTLVVSRELPFVLDWLWQQPDSSSTREK